MGKVTWSVARSRTPEVGLRLVPGTCTPLSGFQIERACEIQVRKALQLCKQD